MRELPPSGKRSHRPSLGLALLGHKKAGADVATLLLKLEYTDGRRPKKKVGVGTYRYIQVAGGGGPTVRKMS